MHMTVLNHPEGLKPDQITYSLLINACANAQPARLEDAMTWLNRMVAEGLKPDQITYNTVINACANAP